MTPKRSHFYNDPVGGVEIIKVNEDNHSERIPNTTFEIRKVDDALVDTVTTDKNGRVFVALEDGSYYAKEVTSNKSFRLDDTPHYFEIKDGKRVTLQVTNNKAQRHRYPQDRQRHRRGDLWRKVCPL